MWYKLNNLNNVGTVGEKVCYTNNGLLLIKRN